MTSRIAAYSELLERGNDGDLDFQSMFVEIFRDMDARLAAAEARVASVAEIQKTLTDYGQAIVDQTVNPLVEQLLASADLGTVFTAHSVSSVNLADAVVTFTILEEERVKFAPAAALIAMDQDNPENVIYGRKSAYNRTTGEIQVEVISAKGTGIVSSWEITAGSLAGVATAVTVTPEALVTANNLQLALRQLSSAIGDNPEFATDVMDALADRYTSDEVDDLLAGKATPANIASAIADLGLKTASQNDVQTGLDDATTGSVLINGAFGLGLSSLVSTPMQVTDLNNVSKAGFYIGAGSGTTNGPVSNFAGMFLHLPSSPSRCAQIAVHQGGDLYVRAKNTGTWGAWKQATLT